MVPHQGLLSPRDEVSKAVGAARAQREGIIPISCCPLNVILAHVAVETPWTQDESIEFSSDVTIILGIVYKHTFQMLREYLLVRFTSVMPLLLGTLQLSNKF